MKQFLWVLFCLLNICFIYAENDLVERSPGDQIWSKCANITTTVYGYTFSIQNSCVKLTEVEDCGVEVDLTIAGKTVLDQRLDLSVASRTCGNYNIVSNGLNVSCDVCVALRNHNTNVTQQCVRIEPTCQIPGIPIPLVLDPYEAGCFGNDKLIAIENCKNGQCPAPNNLICSNHGSCNAGKCSCDKNWFGGDCSYPAKIFEQCRQVDRLSGNVCVRLVFDSCNLKLQVVLVSGAIEVPLGERVYPVRSLNTVFKQDICFDTSGCKTCLKWNNLVLNPTNAAGCGILTFTCASIPLANYDLGCFNDTTVVPSCFGTCPGNCNGHGRCDLGTCYCTQGWSGDDCLTQALVCPNNCGGKGTCNNGVCSCINGYIGSDCSIHQTSSSSSIPTSKSSINPAFIIVPLVFLVGASAVGVAIWYIKKKRDLRPKFNQFDLLEEDTLAPTQEMTE